VSLRDRLVRFLPPDPLDHPQFLLLLVWMEVGGGAIGAAALVAAWWRGWIGGLALVAGLGLLPAVVWLLARLVWLGVAGTSRGFIGTLLATGDVPMAASFSAEEALVAKGRVPEAVAGFEERLRRTPGSAAVRLALAALYRDQVGDAVAAERLYLECAPWTRAACTRTG
jgi:hypothetical protein